MVDSHVLKELSQLNSFAQQSKNANLASGFAKKIIDNSGFKEFASKSRPDIDLGQLDLFSNEGKELYGNFLKDLHTTDPKSPKHAVLQGILDNMKIFDLNASTSGEVNTDKTEQVDVKASCSIFYDDLWKDEPVFTEREVRYGNRPSTVQSFTRECREDYEKMLTTITDDYKKRNPQDYEDLKKELQADFPEDWEKKLNRKMRKMAKKEWKNAKKNTKEVGKALGSERRWRGGSDDKMNYSETYDQVIQPKVEQENWNNRDYKSRSLNGN